MSTLISILFFFAGVHYMILFLASCYRVVDLWYRIGDFWMEVFGTIVLLIVFNAFISYLLPVEFKSAWLWGQLLYFAFHVVIFWIIRLGIRLAQSSHLKR